MKIFQQLITSHWHISMEYPGFSFAIFFLLDIIDDLFLIKNVSDFMHLFFPQVP